MNDYKIDASNESDVEYIARSIVHADQVIRDSLGIELDGSVDDLERIQSLLDSGLIEKEAAYTLQSLGLAFGRVFINEIPDYDWWMIEDEHGRDPVIRYKQSSLIFHPQTMISKRIEDGESINVCELYEGLLERLFEIVREGVDGA